MCELLDEILPNDGTVEDFKVEHDFQRIGRGVMILNAHRMERGGRADKILLVIYDVTEREYQHQRWLLEGEKEYSEKIVDASAKTSRRSTASNGPFVRARPCCLR